PLDDHSHGTHVAGTIGAIGNNAVGVAGVNWAVKILSLKIFGPGGAGANGIVEAIDYCTDNNIKISNNSWGGRFFSQPIYDVIDRARLAGHLFVAAAGNDSINNDTDTFPAYPASYDLDNIISVAALTEAGGLAGFSNYGPTTVDIAAPGDEILSTFPTYQTDSMLDNGMATSYESISGTSMTSPHVAGVAALLLSLNPSLTYDQLRDSIYAGAVTNPALVAQVDGGRELNALQALLNLPRQIRLDRTCYQTNALVTITISDGLTLPPINQIQAALQWFGNSIILTLDRVVGTVNFETIFDLATLPPPPPVHGDPFLVTFTNLQGQVATTTALIDTVPPQILDVRVLNASDTEARLQWRTDEAVSSELFVGTNVPIAVAVSGNLTETLEVQPDGSTQFVYRIIVPNLEQATKYFAALRLEDCAGNVSTYPSNLASTVESDYLLFVTRVRRVVIESNFDQGPSGWTPGSLSGGVLWEHGVPSYGPFTANSPDFAWGTILNGRYLSEEKNAWVESPVLAVEEFPGLEFVAWYKINDFHPLSPGTFFPVPDLDFAMVEVNGGPGWINVTQLSDVLYGQIKVTGDGSAWQAFRIPLVGVVSNSTLQVRFRLETDETGTAPGFYFDDFKVTDVALLGVSILAIRIDDSAGGDGDGFAEPGEAFVMDMTVFNSEFTRTLTNVNATVGSIESGISVSLVDGSVSFGDIPAAEIATSGNQIGVSLAPSIANETRATFFMSATADNGGPYAERFSLLIGDRETITGTVSNLFGGAGIDAATVRGTAAGHPDLVALTDSNGVYRLHGAVPGISYEVFAGKPGAFSPSAPQLLTGPASSLNFGLGQAFANVMPTNFVFALVQGLEQTDQLRLDNGLGNIPLDYEIVIDHADQAFSDWLLLSSSSGSLAPGAPQLAINVTVSAELLAVGLYQADLVLKSNDIGGQDLVVPVVLNVLPGPVLSLQRVEVSGGDGDPFAEAGENNNLTFTLVNSGSRGALSPLGILEFVAPTGLVTVVDNFATWPPIGPQRAGKALDPAVVALDPSVADGQVLDFKLSVTENAQTWVFPFAITSVVRQAISGRVTTFTNPVMGVVG
ncbi:MAG: S8 family peptidase, partial [Verrucomicrobiota bacterium]